MLWVERKDAMLEYRKVASTVRVESAASKVLVKVPISIEMTAELLVSKLAETWESQKDLLKVNFLLDSLEP